MVAAMCEEVQNPEREVPKGMVLSVAAAGVTGIVFLLPVLFVLPNVPELLKLPSGMPIGAIFMHATGTPGGGFGLLFLLLGILGFAGTGALTAASRCTYAFARDGAIPGSKIWSRVDKRLELPVYGLLLSTAVCSLLGLIFFGSSAAFNAFTGVATICLSASYALPIFISLINKRRHVQNAPYSLGKYLGYFANIVTTIWICFAVVLFCMPVAVPVTPQSMNYASVVFMGFFAIAALWYVLYGYKNFTGPKSISVIAGIESGNQSVDEEVVVAENKK
ncbi:hypothetical protein D0Z03_002502 [Geotrichum reessii]|nr:hypothetical protein D0Z03_002502 [Galactomyces reessii]